MESSKLRGIKPAVHIVREEGCIIPAHLWRQRLPCVRDRDTQELAEAVLYIWQAVPSVRLRRNMRGWNFR
jgi:hypothetical protein